MMKNVFRANIWGDYIMNVSCKAASHYDESLGYLFKFQVSLFLKIVALCQKARQVRLACR